MFQIWPRVKAANAHLSSVCELGAIVGSMWRALDPADKQYYNDQFTREKVSDGLMRTSFYVVKIAPNISTPCRQ